MSSEKGWKTVNNGKKTTTNGKLSLTRNDKKKLTNSMPRMDPIIPLKETPTIYQRFMEEELKAEKKAERSGRKEEAEVVKGGGRKKLKNLNLREAIAAIDEDELLEIVMQGRQTFPNNPEIALKDLATCINLQLPNPPNSDPVLSNKPYNFPLSEAGGPKESSLSSHLMHSYSDAVILSCLDHCIDSLILAVSKEQSSMGYRMVIQLILKRKPHLVTKRLQKFDQLLQKHSNRPLRNLLVLWSFAQAAYTSLNNGLKIWFRLMFSQVNVKNVNLFVIEVLEKLFKLHPNLSSAAAGSSSESEEVALSKTDYFKFFSEAHSTQSTLPDPLKLRLKNLHPCIKQVAWSENSHHLSSFFIGYLSRCVSECPEEKKRQLLECGVGCLLREPRSFEAWAKEVPKYTSQSAILLEHVTKSGLASKLLGSESRWKVTRLHVLLPPLRLLKEGPRSETSTEALVCLQYIEAMKQKGKWGRLSLLFFFFILLTPFILFAADLHQHGHVHKTRTAAWIKESGAEEIVTEVFARVSLKSALAYKWLSDNCPSSLKHSLSSLPPFHFNSIAAYIQTLMQLFHKLSKQFNDQLPYLLEHLTTAAGYIIQLLLSFYHYISSFLQSILEFLLQRVFVGEWSADKLQAHMTNLTTAVKLNMQHVVNSFQQYLRNEATN